MRGVAKLLALAETAPATAVCTSCGNTAALPMVGMPEGWDGIYSNKVGWDFTCPECLEAIEENWRAGMPSPLGGGISP